jgi:hypothetical protein
MKRSRSARSQHSANSSHLGAQAQKVSFLEGIAPTESQVASLLSQGLTPTACKLALVAATKTYRARLIPLPVLTMALLYFILGRLRSLLDVVDQLNVGRLPGLPATKVSAQAFYKRMVDISHEVFLKLLCTVSMQLGVIHGFERSDIALLAPFAARIIAIDDTTLDALVRRTKELQELAKGAMETLGGRLGCALDLATGRFLAVEYDRDSAANEKTHLIPLMLQLPLMSLLVLDLGYFGFTVFDAVTDHYCFFVTRLREKTSFNVLQTLADGAYYRDHIIELGKHRSDKARYPVRLVEIRIFGTWHRYLTNVLSPKMLPATKVWALYAQRWSIEIAFAAIKRALGLAYLRNSHLNGVLMQVWCTLLVFQVLQSLRIQIAQTAGWNTDDVSWEMLMRRIAWYAEDSPDEPLTEWLSRNAEKLNLKKRGVRKRTRSGLPPEVLAEMRTRVPEPVWDTLRTRTPRQSDRGEEERPRQLRITVTLDGKTLC